MKASVRFTSLFWAFFFVACNCAKGESVSPIDTFIQEVSRIKQVIIEDMDSFFIKCDRLHCEDVLRSGYSGGDIPLSWELGWQGQNFYVKRTFFPTEAQKRLESVLISDVPTTLILKKGDMLDWHEGVGRCYVDTFDDVMINMMNEWALFGFLGYNVAEKIINSSGNSYDDVYKQREHEPGYEFLTLPYLPEFIASNYSQYSTRQAKEPIDGYDCFVFEWKDRDILWVDPDHHWVIRKRTVFTDNNHKRFTVSYQDYKEIKPDVWFPFQLSVDLYADPSVEPESNWGKVAKRWIFDVRELNTEKLPDSLFSVSPPPGTTVIDGIRKTEYTISDSNADPFAGAIERGLKANRYVMFRAICIIVGSILILIAVWRMLRNKGG